MTGLDSSTTITSTDAVISTTIGDEVVLLNEHTGEYQGLGGIGPSVWELLDEPMTVAEVLATVEDEYDDLPDEWATEVRSFIEALHRANLVEVVDTSAQ